MRKQIMLFVSLLTFAAIPNAVFGQADCSTYDFSWPQNPAWTTYTDWIQHGTGDHTGSAAVTGTCTYTGDYISGYCTTTCTSTTQTANVQDWGLIEYGLEHTIRQATTQGFHESPGGWVASAPSAECGGQAVFGVNSCLLGLGCNFSISISAGADGLGGSVSASASLVWTSTTLVASETCPAHLSPGCIPNYDDQPPPEGANGIWEWDSNHCIWVWHIFSTDTPIIIDTDGSGFHLTSAAQGIKWNFFGSGLVQIAWTAAGSTNGWLAIDLNGNGTIDSAKELFSNVSPQPADPGDPNAPNGFNALAAYDTNHDGMIDNKDPVWPKLLVWIDSNHDGISQPGELHHLDDIGIHSISLKYTVFPLTDAYGNKFHLRGRLNPEKADDVNRVIYDVDLTTAN